MKIFVDSARCEGYGFCEQSAPDLLHLDDAGELEILSVHVPDDREAAAEGAVRVCPVAALRVER